MASRELKRRKDKVVVALGHRKSAEGRPFLEKGGQLLGVVANLDAKVV